MTPLVFPVLLALNFMLLYGKGQIILPREGDTFLVLPGENVTIEWKLNVSVSDIRIRDWRFLSNTKGFAEILGDGDVDEKPENSPGPFRIEKPSTLILENVNIQYDGKYRFSIFFKSATYTSDVTVVVLVNSTVTINCTSPLHQNHRLILSEGENFTCLCKAKGGNPPADVTWRKDGVLEPGGPGKEQKTLTRNDISNRDNGAYTCVARSYTLINGKSIEVKANSKTKPTNTSIMITPKRVKVGGSVVIMCKTYGVPEPKYNITHNDTEISTEKTHAICNVDWKDAGTYKCCVLNEFGYDSDYDTLTIEQGSTTPTSKATIAKEGDGRATNKGDEIVVVWHIVVSLLSGIIIGFLLCYIVSCSCRRWFTNKESNPEAQTTAVDTTYQELDLTKMNTEDNYQSLRVNAANNDTANDDDSTYTELNKTRDVENNYQSLK